MMMMSSNNCIVVPPPPPSSSSAATSVSAASAIFQKLSVTQSPTQSQQQQQLVLAGGAVTSSSPPPPPAVMTSSTGGGGCGTTVAASGGGGGGAKDSRWLTLEVCREHVRRRCSRSDDECRFAHPPPHVEVQNGRVVCCFDSIKGRCQRTDPPCKYLHPPQHLKEQLLQNGRNNLIMKNLHLQRLQTMPPTAIYSFVNPYMVSSPHAACYPPPYFSTTSPCSVAAATSASCAVSNGIIGGGAGGGGGVCAVGPAVGGHSCGVPASAVNGGGNLNGNSLLQASPTPTAAAAAAAAAQMESECCGRDDVADDQFVNWTVAPPGAAALYAAVDANSNPAAAAPYFPPVFFQSVNGAPPGVVLKPHQAVVGDMKNGYAVYSCASTAFHQLAMPFPQAPCYPMAIAAPAPPVVAGSYQRY